MRAAENTIDFLIDDIGGVIKAARICGVHKTTVYRWLRGETVTPQAAYRALYHASRWGRSERAVYSENAQRIAGDLIATLEAQLRQREAELARVLVLCDFGSANAPLYRMIRR